MFWADELAASVDGPQVVNDSKTPSGTVHVGSLRGPVIHDQVHRALLERGIASRFLYGVEDLDPMDAQALLTPDAVDRYMGVPLAEVPAPEGSDATSYARHFVGTLFLPTFARLGIHPEFYWLSEIYPTGRLDPYIRIALDRAEEIRALYMRVSRVEKPAGWLPLHARCESCGKIGTTLVTDWDGETVRYQCLPDFVAWARGCGNEGRISPFGGRAKMPFNVEWASKWSLFGVTIEGCGKDLATAGGSRDRSDAISREIFEREPPRNVMYEFLNIGGRKMSTSKGRGAAAHRIAEVVPGEVLRFLFLRPRPNQAIEFDPEGTDAIPRLFDEFDRIAGATAGLEVKGQLPPDPDRLFAASLLDPGADVAAEAGLHRPAFAHLALLAQIPGTDIPARIAAEKGAPLTDAEARLVDERTSAARAWLEAYAPPEAVVAVRTDGVPPLAATLAPEQRAFLASLAAAAEAAPPASGDAWQTAIFDAARASDLPPGRAFAALYAAFLDRPNGPRAGWLLAGLAPDLVLARLRAAAAPPAASATGGAS
ncbi:MAG: lysine--tRNA ligase [Chloroflexi bacterium]|jgi:lysyl-tRNA synthetase class 1|nr:lysine--tRNA ligase [Chloroflexota bacterium]